MSHKAKRKTKNYRLHIWIALVVIFGSCIGIQQIIKFRAINEVTEAVSEQCEIASYEIESPKFFTDDYMIEEFSGEISTLQLEIYCKKMSPANTIGEWQCSCTESSQ